MAHFVLIHGAWHGGWAWTRTMNALNALGHTASAPTLTGLGERAHLMSEEITPDLHVQDVTGHLRYEALSDVILVGHSYGGIVITGAAGQCPERIRALVYLDAFAPDTSDPVFAKANPARMAEFQKEIDRGAIALEANNFHAWTDDPEAQDWLRQMCTPHPARCFTDGVHLTGREKEIAHKHFILCARNTPSPFWAEYEKVQSRSGWSTAKLETMHDAMVEAPDTLARHLSDYEAVL